MPENFRIGDDPDAALQAIRAAYIAQLPERLREIGACVQQCLDAPGDAEQYEHLLMNLHKLAGSAGTFGFSALGQRATEQEILLDGFMKDMAHQDFAPLAAGIHDMLRTALDQNSSQLPGSGTL